ncbi:sensor histidine kinase [Rhodanobacter sp. FDAARGOS 1247]|jgi:two-component system sensor histidine kinase DesK|uniref:sensor histidine kinase n=1 Tax=Rhodanobacter sp. FDAARGOS 1247 TaxID=2778082 RepID=UPI00194E1F6B|nr:sensor histidine kinase [Rhodanobacter sp. FDAARGOS 1247]QRP64877.1 sensor histidine kinase [Rhodanobacter sp. FDAARGOS 1247]
MIPAFIARWFVPAPDSAVADDLRRGKSPWTDSVHLLWSLWIFITPMFDNGLRGYTLTWLLFTLASYPVFLLLFAKLRLASRRSAHLYAWGMAVLCFALLRWYPSGLSYFVYACVMLSHCDRRSFRNYVLQVLAVNIIYVVLAWQIGFPTALLVIMPVTVFVICIIVTVEQLHKEKDAALSLSHDEVRRLAATAERERIGRDLHDLLGHTLSLITLKLELSRKLFDRDVEAARREVEEAEKVARHALAEVRSAVTGIRATDLAAELASARLLLESSRVHLEYNAPSIDMPAEIERGLSLLLREAVTNIARHAAASCVQIELRREHAAVCMQVSDNGRGGIAADGNGISGMRERVRALGGTLEVQSPLGGGTQLRVVVPVPVLRLVEPPRAPPAATPAQTSSGYPAA